MSCFHVSPCAGTIRGQRNLHPLVLQENLRNAEEPRTSVVLMLRTRSPTAPLDRLTSDGELVLPQLSNQEVVS